MPPRFAAFWKDDGFIEGVPPCLVVPYEGLSLVWLRGAGAVHDDRGFTFDRSNLTVTPVPSNRVLYKVMAYSENFPPAVRNDVLALTTTAQSWIQNGATLLAVEGSVTGVSAQCDWGKGAQRAKLDVVTVRRRTVTVSFRYIRYRDEKGGMGGGTTLDPSGAEALLDVMNRLYMPNANIAFTFRSAKVETVDRALGRSVGKENFLQHVVPRRDPGAEITVFFLGRWTGGDDPLGTAFHQHKCVVVDDRPWQYMAPQKSWPEGQYTDDQIYDSPSRPASDRDLHLVLAHELAHMLGAGHNDAHDNLMSAHRQDIKFTEPMVMKIGGR